MSSIASFYLIANADVAHLKEAAAAPLVAEKRRFLPYYTGQQLCPLWEFLCKKARELEDYGWSGRVIGTDLYFYLESRAIKIEHYQDEELSVYLSNATKSCLLAFRRQGAEGLVDVIERLCPRESVSDYCRSEELNRLGVTDPDDLQPLLDGLGILRRWLLQVDDDHFGLLSIG